MTETTNDQDLDGLAKLKRARDEIRRQVGTAIVGQDEVVNQLLDLLVRPRPLRARGRARDWPRRC